MPCSHVADCQGCGERRRIKARGLCTRCYNRKWNRDHLDQVRAGNERWRVNNPDTLRSSRKSRVRDPIKRKAQVAVANAIRDGRLKREPCEKCGAEPTQAHHDDYLKPLEVRWLCRTHHIEEHLLEVVS